jgi:hypothetical protein
MARFVGGGMARFVEEGFEVGVETLVEAGDL